MGGGGLAISRSSHARSNRSSRQLTGIADLSPMPHITVSVGGLTIGAYIFSVHVIKTHVNLTTLHEN